MKLLNAVNEIFFAQTWMEIVQAIGTAVALPMAVWGIVKLFKKDLDRQKQIDSLAKMAEESSNQTEVLEGQLKKMEESNKIWSDYIQTLAKFVSTSQESVDFQKKQFEQNERLRKIEIMPIIKSRGGGSSSQGGEIRFKNIGGKVKVIDITKGENNNVALPGLANIKGSELDSTVRSISWRTKGDQTRETSRIHLIITLKDIDENIYSVVVSGPVTKPTYSDPKEENLNIPTD